MDELIARGVADDPVEWMGGELTYIETFQFTRKGDMSEWLGPFHCRPLLEQILNAEEIEFELMDTPEEAKREATEQLIEKVKADEELRNKQKEIIESNRKELEIVINKIDNINNNDVSYEETDKDKEKSKIIIDGIWEVYGGDKNGK
jgi:hypothetical protein